MSSGRALFFSQTGMSEPLGRSQVLPYVRGLARSGYRMAILSMEPREADETDLTALASELRRERIRFAWTRRRQSASLRVKAEDAKTVFKRLVEHLSDFRPDIVHARSDVPSLLASMAIAVRPGAKLLYDCRGLVADEYAEAQHWDPSGPRYHLLKGIEASLFARADGIVVLTECMRRWLREESRLVPESTPVQVVPCCVDLDRFRFDPNARLKARQELGAGDRFVLVYSGSLSAWYCERETAQFFAALRRQREALLLVLTRSPTERLLAHLRAHGVAENDVIVKSVPSTRMAFHLAGADAAVAFRTPSLASYACSPTKIPEYLALGLPVVMNRGVGDGDSLLNGDGPFVDAGAMQSADLDHAARQLLQVAPSALAHRERGRSIAVSHFALSDVGVIRYRTLYERLLQSA